MGSVVSGPDIFDRLANLLATLSQWPPRWSSRFIRAMDDFDELWDVDDPLLSDDPVTAL